MTNWNQEAAESPYRTAVAVRDELLAGHVEEAVAGLQELIDALSRSERRALKSHLIQLMAHIIKWKSQSEQRKRSWAATIANARAEIRDIQEETPSLTDAVIQSLWDQCLQRAQRQAEGEMNQPAAVSALTWDEVFTHNYQV